MLLHFYWILLYQLALLSILALMSIFCPNIEELKKKIYLLDINCIVVLPCPNEQHIHTYMNVCFSKMHENQLQTW